MFSFGVLAGAIACAGAYLAQYGYQVRTDYIELAERLMKNDATADQNKYDYAMKKSRSHLKWGRRFHFATLVLVFGSFVMFGLGVWFSIQAVATHLPSL